MIFSLCDHQLQQITKAASLLDVSRRDSFLRSVANRLDLPYHPADADVAYAINFVLGCYGIAIVSSNKPQRRCYETASRL